MRRPLQLIVFGTILIVGAVGFFIFTVYSLSASSRRQQFLVPGDIEVTIEEPGRYYLWNDYQTIYQGRSFRKSEALPDNIIISLREKNSDLKAGLTGDVSISSSIGSYSKNSIGYFKIGKPGQYTLRVKGKMQPRVFSFGELKIFKIFIKLFSAIAILGILALIGVVLCVFGVIKAVKSKEA